MPREQKLVTRKPRRRNFRRKGGKMTYNRVRSIARQEVMKEEKKTEELKYFITANASISISAVGQIFGLTNTIAQGTSETQRIGTQITLRNVLTRFDVTHDDSTNVFRIILFRWMEEGTPAVADILQDTTIVPWLSSLSAKFAKSIQVIYDKSYSMSTNTDANIVGKIFKKLRGNAIWEPTAIGVGRQKGQLYLLAISDSAVGGLTFKHHTKVRYVDA